MDCESFLKEELKKIDLKLSQNQTVFTYPDFSLFDLTSFAETEQVFYFESKEEDFSFLGLGTSKLISLSDVQRFVDENPSLVLVYQSLFEKETPPLIYLPEWCFVRQNKSVTLHIHPSLEFGSISPSNIILNTQKWESFLGHWQSYEEKPESDEWREMIQKASTLFSKKILEKIVLSRKKIYYYTEPIENLVMFRELYLANLESSHFSLFHQFNYQEAFISFTPERLFTLKKNKIETISLAGSTGRGQSEEEDRALENELINSDKLIREHAIVTKSIQDKLSPITRELEISPLFTMKLPYIQHRKATITGTLNEGVEVVDLIDLLHPTPAVGGLPQAQAMEKILELEKDKRDYYAAPVGVITKNFSELAVGIRSAHILGQEITVFGGAGIVSGSDPEEEWIETGTKMRPFIKVINKSII